MSSISSSPARSSRQRIVSRSVLNKLLAIVRPNRLRRENSRGFFIGSLDNSVMDANLRFFAVKHKLGVAVVLAGRYLGIVKIRSLGMAGVR